LNVSTTPILALGVVPPVLLVPPHATAKTAIAAVAAAARIWLPNFTLN